MALGGLAGVDLGSSVGLWDRWRMHDPESMREANHSAWESFLTRYVRIGSDSIHRVAYEQVAPVDRTALDEYLAELSRTPISQFKPTEQLAFWINRCIQIEDDQPVVSSLLRWYREDFGGSDWAVISHLMGFAEPHLAMKLQQFDRIAGDVFDWRLNDATAS